LNENLAKYFTTTVGLVCTSFADEVNIMAAEWTYLVAKTPPHVAIVISDNALTQRVAETAGEFSVTLCSARQAALADFAGSISGRQIDKTASRLLSLRAPEVTSTPWADGGLLALECQVRHVVPLPAYLMLIGEALAVHADPSRLSQPLVKHGAMHALGEPLTGQAAVAAAELSQSDGQELRVAATGPGAADGTPWRVSLVGPAGAELFLGEASPNQYGDLLASFRLPGAAARWNLPESAVRVERDGLDPGWAAISFRGFRGETNRQRPGQFAAEAADKFLASRC
jgi:flavin reductase (DIM6/NTAB) family NADH-FMN oxidoreductase RutF